MKIDRAPQKIHNTGSVSIKQMLQPNAPSIDLDPSNLPKKAFSEEELLKAWNNYAYHIRGKDIEFFGTLTAPPPVLKDDFLIQKTVYNVPQQNDILKAKTELLHFLRTKLNNYSIDLEVIVDSTIEVNKILSPKEKLAKMLEKNKALAKLKDQLKLEL